MRKLEQEGGSKLDTLNKYIAGTRATTDTTTNATVRPVMDAGMSLIIVCAGV